MTVNALIELGIFEVVSHDESTNFIITKPFCCDLLSFAMSKAPVGAAWVTVMGNVNTIAVASLTEVSCIILAEGVALDTIAFEKAKQQKLTVLSTRLPIFEAAFLIHQEINKEIHD